MRFLCFILTCILLVSCKSNAYLDAMRSSLIEAESDAQIEKIFILNGFNIKTYDFIGKKNVLYLSSEIELIRKRGGDNKDIVLLYNTIEKDQLKEKKNIYYPLQNKINFVITSDGIHDLKLINKLKENYFILIVNVEGNFIYLCDIRNKEVTKYSKDQEENRHPEPPQNAEERRQPEPPHKK